MANPEIKVNQDLPVLVVHLEHQVRVLSFNLFDFEKKTNGVNSINWIPIIMDKEWRKFHLKKRKQRIYILDIYQLNKLLPSLHVSNQKFTKFI